MTTYPLFHRAAAPAANFYHLLSEELFDPALRNRVIPVHRPAEPAPLGLGALWLGVAALAICGLFAYAVPLMLGGL